MTFSIRQERNPEKVQDLLNQRISVANAGDYRRFPDSKHNPVKHLAMFQRFIGLTELEVELLVTCQHQGEPCRGECAHDRVPAR